MGGQDQNAAECGEGNHRKGKLSPECTANLVAVRLAGILAGIGAEFDALLQCPRPNVHIRAQQGHLLVNFCTRRKLGITDRHYGEEALICGGLAKTISVFATYPISTVRTRIQQNQFIVGSSQPKYSGATEIVWRMVQ
mgnify:CR=1 FL=1